VRSIAYLILRRQNLLNTYLIDQVVALQIGQMCSLFVVCQMRANPLRHHQNKRSIIHVQPIATADQPILSVPGEGTVRFRTKVRLVKAGHVSPSRGQLPKLTRRRFDISLAKASGMLPKRLQLGPHEFHLNSKDILNILRAAQLANKFLGGGNPLKFLSRA
jgi:hypothetical protein